jgi:hypothetical protein
MRSIHGWASTAGALSRCFKVPPRALLSNCRAIVTSAHRLNRSTELSRCLWHTPSPPSSSHFTGCEPHSARKRAISSSAAALSGGGGGDADGHVGGGDADATVGAIVSGALAHVRDYGWTDEAIAVAVADLGLPSVAEVRAF